MRLSAVERAPVSLLMEHSDDPDEEVAARVKEKINEA